ncbi:MAG: HxsD-like protein [Myxococcales bacterium]|nr:HxsD-like protein [Myxococcales bacterium]
MKELRFSREVYAGEAVDQAVKTWSRFADFELSQTDEHWIVKLTPKHADAARQIIGEFGNYVLGLTVDRGGAG